MNHPSQWSTILVLQQRLELSGVAVRPYFGVEDGAAVINVEDEARSRIREWAAVAVNKLIYTISGEALEVDEVDEGSGGRITTNLNAIATRL